MHIYWKEEKNVHTHTHITETQSHIWEWNKSMACSCHLNINIHHKQYYTYAGTHFIYNSLNLIFLSECLLAMPKFPRRQERLQTMRQNVWARSNTFSSIFNCMELSIELHVISKCLYWTYRLWLIFADASQSRHIHSIKFESNVIYSSALQHAHTHQYANIVHCTTAHACRQHNSIIQIPRWSQLMKWTSNRN